MSKQKTKFQSVLEATLKLALYWLYGVTLLSLFRITMIAIYHNKITSENPDFLQTLVTGFTFDTNVVTYFLLIPFLLNLTLFTPKREIILSKTRLFFIIFFTVITLFLSIITITYFKEYDNQFNYNLFEGLYDDKVAIAKTIIDSYNPLLSLTIFVFFLLISAMIIKRIEKFKINLDSVNSLNIFNKIILLTTIVLLFIFALRGAIGFDRPAMRKWAYVTKDNFLNKTIINPVKSLIYAYKDYKYLHNIDKTNPYLSKNKNIETVMKEVYQPNSNQKPSLKNIITKSVQKGSLLSPDHIILVVMESYDSWPLQDKFKDLHISDNLREIAKRGVHFKSFLPGSPNTMNSLASIISGIPYAGVNISRLKASGKAETTSIFEQFKKLGYSTYFFYGGLSSWQNVGNFVKTQGAEHIMTSIDIDDNISENIWGVDDSKLFKLVTDTLQDKKKSFSIIMTTSYHPPYTVDVYKYGYKYHSKNDYPLKYQKLYDGSLKPYVLGHLWYSDQVLGTFVRNFQQKNPNTLFAFTGDHYSRRYFNAKPNLYESSSVPFILYGCQIEKKIKKSNATGNHINIMPTLLELVAPKGFIYYSFATPMIQRNKNDLTVTYKKAMKGNTVYEFLSGNTLKLFDINKTRIINLSDPKYLNSPHKEIHIKYKNLMAIYWHATIKGIK